ncbi:hypothetical protein [Paenibacillus sp. WLX2291]|uniref:hypothetical protein n=1 Tax=Paenibacillus sp. WLX2291 TaxID=3296934 RepID=UPI003983F0A6
MGWEYGVTVKEQDDNDQNAEHTARQLIRVWYERLFHIYGQQYRFEQDETGFAVYNDNEPEWPHLLEVQLQPSSVDGHSLSDTSSMLGSVELYLLFHIGGKQAAPLLEEIDSVLAQYAPGVERFEY